MRTFIDFYQRCKCLDKNYIQSIIRSQFCVKSYDTMYYIDQIDHYAHTHI